MEQLFLLALVVAVVVAMAAAARLIARPTVNSPNPSGESQIGVATEGMKVCPRCRMGNLWTDRDCSACGAPLKG